MKCPKFCMNSHVKSELKPYVYLSRYDQECDEIWYKVDGAGKFLGTSIVDCRFVIAILSYTLGEPEYYMYDGIKRSFVWKKNNQMLIFDRVEMVISITLDIL